jgi:hypothetical protein
MLIMKKYLAERSSNRTTIQQPVSFELIELESGRPRNIVGCGFGVNIGAGGMGLTTDYPLKEGAVLKLDYPVAAGNARLPVYTEVVWARTADGKFRAGLRFLA